MGTFYKFEIRGNEFLKNSTTGCYSIDFLSYGQSGQLSFLHKLKNNWLKNSEYDLLKSKDEAVSKIYNFLMDLNSYSMKCNETDSLCFVHGFNIQNKAGDWIKNRERVSFAETRTLVCRVPRSKVNMQDSQLLFQSAIREAIELVNNEWRLYKHKDLNHALRNNLFRINFELFDGIDCIKRIKDVPTTHLTGDRAYPGITKDSCDISDKVDGKTILLIDDIYTLGVGVVEDCIQALYDKGAWKVIFYAVGRTVKNSNSQATKIEV